MAHLKTGGTNEKGSEARLCDSAACLRKSAAQLRKSTAELRGSAAGFGVPQPGPTFLPRPTPNRNRRPSTRRACHRSGNSVSFSDGTVITSIDGSWRKDVGTVLTPFSASPGWSASPSSIRLFQRDQKVSVFAEPLFTTFADNGAFVDGGRVTDAEHHPISGHSVT
jgi:hypothetical protein